MALDISRQLSLQQMTSQGRATPWHGLSPGVLILFIDISLNICQEMRMT